jgi:apolipoprotein N-acyltransferase
MSLGRALAATALSGCAYGLCFPTASLQALAWFALVPFLLALRVATTRRALVLGWIWTIVAAYTLGDWFASSIATYYQQSFAVGLAFFFGVSSFMAAPSYMAFAVWYARRGRRVGPFMPLVVGAAWVAGELGRVVLVTGNPWALFGYSQLGRDHLVQIADATGVYGVSFVLVVVNAALAQLVVARTGRSCIGVAVAALLAAGVVGYGQFRLTTIPAVADASPPVRVAMVQGNLDLGAQWREELYGSNLDVYLGLTRDVLAQARPALVVWPEGALSFFLEDEPLYRRAIALVMEPSGAELVVGGPRVIAADSTAPRYFNSIFLLAPDGAIRARYDKRRLVPFGEYYPFATRRLLRRPFARVREFTPGDAQHPLPTAVGPAGTTICNEAMFPEIAAARVADGATFFVDPANDTWLTPKFSAQQFDIVRLRTVEQRRYLVRASTSGPSAIVDPLGRVRVRTEFLNATAIAGDIHPSTVVTPYWRFGDAFAYACTLIAVVAALRPSSEDVT